MWWYIGQREDRNHCRPLLFPQKQVKLQQQQQPKFETHSLSLTAKTRSYGLHLISNVFDMNAYRILFTIKSGEGTVSGGGGQV